MSNLQQLTRQERFPFYRIEISLLLTRSTRTLNCRIGRGGNSMYRLWLTCVLVFVLAIFFVEGGVFAETSPLSSNYPAEEWVKENAVFGEVDLTRRFEHENDRVIRATFLERLLTEPHKGLEL